MERLWRDAKLLEIGGGTLEAHHKNMVSMPCRWRCFVANIRPGGVAMRLRCYAMYMHEKNAERVLVLWRRTLQYPHLAALFSCGLPTLCFISSLRFFGFEWVLEVVSLVNALYRSLHP